MKCHTPLDVKLHWAQCVKSNYNRMESFPIGEVWTTQIVSDLQVWATIIGSHLTRKPISSPVLTKCWNLELTLATNFGSHAQMATKFGGQILATKFGFVPDCSGHYHKTSLMKREHWFRLWLGAIKEQALTWANVDSDLHYHMASLGHRVHWYFNNSRCTWYSRWYEGCCLSMKIARSC